MFFLKIDRDLELRLIHLCDSLNLFKLVDENRRHLRTWLPWVDNLLFPQQYVPVIRQWLFEYVNGTGLRAGIYFRGKLAGCVELAGIDFYNRQATIGYFLGKNHEGKGVMTRAVKALIDFSFLRLRLNRLEIRAGEKNARSRAVAERLGFTMEGMNRQGEFLHGRYQDVAIYGLLREEWLATNPENVSHHCPLPSSGAKTVLIRQKDLPSLPMFPDKDGRGCAKP